MIKKNAKPLVAMIAAVIFIAAALWVPETRASASTGQAPHNERIYGVNRYETAAKVSASGWSKSDYVVIATGENYTDALCAVTLAKKYDAPVLLTETAKLSDETIKEIKRLGAQHVIIVGGESAVSNHVMENLISIGVGRKNIKRISGKDRYETSALIAAEVGVKDKVILVSGNNYADAISIASIAAAKGMPILLTEKEFLPDIIKDFIKNRKITGAYVIGGEGVISSKVKYEFDGIILGESKRLAGKDRYETNVNVLREFADDKDLSFNNIFVAVGDGPSGNEFADALSGAALAAKNKAPMILTYRGLPQAAQKYLQIMLKGDSHIIALGGEAVVPESIISSINDIIASIKKSEQNRTASEGGKGNSSSNKDENVPKDITYEYKANDVLIQVTANRVVITYNCYSVDDITITVCKKGTDELKYLGQKPVSNGKCQFVTELSRGYYTGTIRLNGDKIVNLPEFQVR